MANMELAYDLAARAVRQRFAEQHPDYLEALAEVRKGDVAVFSGSFDHVQEILRRLEVPFTLDPEKLTADVVFANCANAPHAALAQGIEAHVRAGAWLVSSDWSLQNLVQAAFPGTVRKGGKRNTGDEVVAVEADLNSLWSEVVVPGADPQWWLEASSFPIEVLDPERVRVEAVSHEMLVRYGEPAVAVRFDWGAGQVYHVVSHFWLKQSRAPGPRHQGPAADFLRAGLRLSEEGVDRVLAGGKAEALNFAEVQTAATSTELVAQLCVHARQRQAVA